jgi:hypothetical protein
MTEVTNLRRPDGEIEIQIAQAVLRYEIARQRAAVVISVGRDANGKLVLVVERGSDKLREALKHPHAIKADVVPRFAAVPERAPLSQAG